MITVKDLWESNNENAWHEALEHYWNLVRPGNIALEQELNELKLEQVTAFNQTDWFKFLNEKYFRWKYTAPNRYVTTTKYFFKYIEDDQLDELFDIKKELLRDSVSNIKAGLTIAMKIKGLGIAGASGLLSLMYPHIYGTVDQFVVKALKKMNKLSQSDSSELNEIKLNKPNKPNKPGEETYNIKISNGVFLIDFMTRKAKELNEKYYTNYWTPRKIDMILWSIDR
jgi:hypothetical protein